MKRWLLTLILWSMLITSSRSAAPDSLSSNIYPLFTPAVDSTHIQASAYGSAADILAELPAVFFFDRGSVGQLALVSLFAGSFRHLDATWDGLLLNDPVSGLADFNLLPAESIHHVYGWPDPANMEYGLYSPGQVLQAKSRNLAGSGLRSAVAYRTGGNGYDDIDVRLGVKPSLNTSLNVGGVLKNYAGAVAEEKYRGQKVNLQLERRFGSLWRLRYLLLLNKIDRQVPWSERTTPQVSSMHEKMDRYDHGVVAEAGRLRILWQYTDLYREFYNYRYQGIRQIQDAGRWRGQLQTSGGLGPLRWNAGGLWQYSHVQVHEVMEKKRHDFEAWLGIQASPEASWHWLAGVKAIRQGDLAVKALPRLQLVKPFSSGWYSRWWYGSHVYSTGLITSYGPEPIVNPERIFHPERSDQFGWAVEKQTSGSQYYVSVSYCATFQDENQERLQPVLSTFVPEQKAWAVDLGIKQKLNACFSFYLKAKVHQAAEEESWPQPGQQAWGYLQYANIFFSGDLDSKLRLGVSYLAERGEDALLPGHVMLTQPLAAVMAPFAYAGFKIKDVHLFFSLQNFLGIDYQTIVGYPMAKQQFRWGFVWDFFD